MNAPLLSPQMTFEAQESAAEAFSVINVVVDELVSAENNPRLAECMQRVRNEITKLSDALVKARPLETRASHAFLEVTVCFALEAIETAKRAQQEGKTGFVVDHMSDKWKWYRIADGDYWEKHGQRAAATQKLLNQTESLDDVNPRHLSANKVCGLLAQIEKAKTAHVETIEAFGVYLQTIKQLFPAEPALCKEIDDIVSKLEADPPLPSKPDDKNNSDSRFKNHGQEFSND
ncbi:MAG: hypothetical protein PHE27_05875 [Alphaproteobacteria bacterium]|nr:hypothetical protein [Alphaproteobacteria bacterium]